MATENQVAKRAEELSEIALTAMQAAERNPALHFSAVALLFVKLVAQLYGADHAHDLLAWLQVLNAAGSKPAASNVCCDWLESN